MPKSVGEPPTTQRAEEVKRIYLTGFMGAGKTTVGALLASRLEWQFVDTDRYIEEQQGFTIAALFDKVGESGFRTVELEALRQLQQQSACVVSLGGGAMETDGVRSLLMEDAHGRLVFLAAPMELLLKRCEAQDAAARPLLRTMQQDQLGFTERFQKRLTHYQKAHLTVATQDLTPEEVAASIHLQMAAFT